MNGPQRDLIGYGADRPTTGFPEGKRLAISLVVNYEEGSERSFAMGDSDQEALTEWGQYPFPPDIRNLAMETMHEYGSRVGVWRLLDMFERHDVKSTFFACAVAFEHAPEVARAAVAAGHEICSHGWRWEEVYRLTEEEEREHIRLAVESFERTCGKRPLGWYCRYGPSVRTRRLLVEEGGFLYDSDSYNDEVPYSRTSGARRTWWCRTHPTRTTSRSGSATAWRPRSSSRRTCATRSTCSTRSPSLPRMMSVGLHCRVIGRPARAPSLERFIEYAKGFDAPGSRRARRSRARGWRCTGRPPRWPRDARDIVKVALEEVPKRELRDGVWTRLALSDENLDGNRAASATARSRRAR